MVLNEHSKLHFKYKGWEDIRRGLAVAKGTSFSMLSLKIDGGRLSNRTIQS